MIQQWIYNKSHTLIVSAGNTAQRWTSCKLVPVVCFLVYRLTKNCRVRPTVCKHIAHFYHFITFITPLWARVPVLSTPLTYRELNLIELLLFDATGTLCAERLSQIFKGSFLVASRLMAVTYVRWLWWWETWGAARWEEGASPSLHLFTLSGRVERRKRNVVILCLLRGFFPVNLTHCCLLSVRGCSCKATCFVCLQDYQCFWFMSHNTVNSFSLKANLDSPTHCLSKIPLLCVFFIFRVSSREDEARDHRNEKWIEFFCFSRRPVSLKLFL